MTTLAEEPEKEGDPLVLTSQTSIERLQQPMVYTQTYHQLKRAMTTMIKSDKETRGGKQVCLAKLKMFEVNKHRIPRAISDKAIPGGSQCRQQVKEMQEIGDLTLNSEPADPPPEQIL